MRRKGKGARPCARNAQCIQQMVFNAKRDQRRNLLLSTAILVALCLTCNGTCEYNSDGKCVCTVECNLKPHAAIKGLCINGKECLYKHSTRATPPK